MMIRKIEINELEDLYNNKILKDFKEDEIPPLFSLVNHFNDGSMEGYFYVEDNINLGYAISILGDKSNIIALFAIDKAHRSKGLGTKFIEDLKNYYNKILIVEVEKPSLAYDKDDLSLRERRIDFYKRNGFILYDNIDYSIFEIDMFLMVSDDLSNKEVESLVIKTYQNVLKPHLMKYVKIHIEDTL